MMPIWHFSFFHVFLSISRNKELDTQPLLSLLQGRDKNIVIPKMCPNRKLEHYLLTDASLIKENHLGIPEPIDGIEVPEEKLDVVFVPLLAHDLKGNRVGYGGGYYDTFLKKCRPDVVKIGLSFFDAVSSVEDLNENDIALDYCVTPGGLHKF